MSDQKSDETLRAFLDRRERELSDEIAALREQLTPKEGELAEVRRAKGSLGISSGVVHFTDDRASAAQSAEPASFYDKLTIKDLIIHALNEHFRSGASSKQLRDFIRDAWNRDIERTNLSPQLSRLKADGTVELDDQGNWILIKSIKEMAIEALFDTKGKTTEQIRQFIRDTYGRSIEPSRLRPQLNGLRTDGILHHEPGADAWTLSLEKRRGYVLYNHPSSRRAMLELQDEPSDDEVGREIARRKLLGKVTTEQMREMMRKKHRKEASAGWCVSALERTLNSGTEIAVYKVGGGSNQFSFIEAELHLGGHNDNPAKVAIARTSRDTATIRLPNGTELPMTEVGAKGLHSRGIPDSDGYPATYWRVD
jgi:hypothetical protein